MNLNFNYKGKKISLNVVRCSWIGRIIGLMFSRREGALALLFDFGKPTRNPIHSMFVFFPFVGIWIDENGKVVDLRVVKPWKLSILPTEKFVKLIEIPINKRYMGLVSSLVGS